MRLCLFEDRPEQLEPLCWTRPVFDLRCGMVTLAQKLVRNFNARSWSALIRPGLVDVFHLEHPGVPVNDADVFEGDDLLLVNGRWLPPEGILIEPRQSCMGIVGGSVAYVVLKKQQLTTLAFEQLPKYLDVWQSVLPTAPAGGRLIEYPWDLVEQNPDEIRRDFRWLPPFEHSRAESLNVMGSRGQIWVAPSANIEPMVMIDATTGPVVIDEHSVVSAFTRLQGPCYIGPHSQVFGAKIRAGTSLGPHCRVGGEVEASILHGFTNKYHDGFLGHSYLGSWVNLGAGTQNSDLRNDYGEITMIQHGQPVLTGMNKIGCFLGDHTKTGLGTLLNTGTSVGAFCSLLPSGRFAPKYIPSFASWWNGSLREAFPLNELLTTAEIAMQRRGVALTDAHRSLYTRLFDETENARRKTLRESEQRLLRRSA